MHGLEHLPLRRLAMLTLRVLHLPARLGLVPLLSAMTLGLMLRRFLAGQSERAAGIALIAGFAAVYPALLFGWPQSTIQRLPGAAVLLLIFTFLQPRLPPRAALPLLSVVMAWWLTGAPLAGAVALQAMPLALGLWLGFVLARRFTRQDVAGLGSLAAALALGAALLGTGASPHWGRAAWAVAGVAIAMIGRGAAAPALGRALVVVNAAAIAASAGGQVWPVDLTMFAPILAWMVVARLKLPAMLAPPPPPAARSRPRPRRPNA